MKRFIVEEQFWSIFPDAKIGVLVSKGLDNTAKNKEYYEKLLLEAQAESKKHIMNDNFTSNPVVASWREAFKKFKTKKGARASIESLLKRVSSGNQIGSINPLVDIYNVVSLKYALPCGGEDIDKFSGNLLLTTAIGNEGFVPLGETEDSPPYPGEIVYKDNQGAVCRSWNWREAKRTILTEETTNAFICAELSDSTREDELKKALEELGNLILKNLGGEISIEILDKNNRDITIVS